MKVIYLAFKMIWKQKFLNIFLIITVICSIYYLSPVLERVIHYKTSVQTLSGLDMKNAYYLYCNPFFSRQNSNLNASIEKKVRSLDYVTGRAELFNLNNEESTYNIMAYNDLLIDKFTPQLSKGIWLDKANISSYTPVVAAKDTDLEYGEVFPLSLASDEKTPDVMCEVIGILADSANILGFSGSADEKYFTSDVLISSADSVIILPFTKNVEALIHNEAYLANTGGSLLYTIPEIDYDTVSADFGYAGIVTNLGAGSNRFYEQSKFVAASMGAYFGVYLLITIVCLLCSSFILNFSAQKVYTIYFLSGMSRSKLVSIETFRIFLLIFTCSMLSFQFMNKSGILINFFENIHPLLVFSVIICYISIIFIPISVVFTAKNKNVNIIESIRNLNTQK